MSPCLIDSPAHKTAFERDDTYSSPRPELPDQIIRVQNQEMSSTRRNRFSSAWKGDPSRLRDLAVFVAPTRGTVAESTAVKLA
jgi:hypothetical protein